jgi:NAD(P)-dependent dehydrogenase (short-subunit alcohol dehydrogenase family)
MSSIIITGANGQLGQTVVRKLLDDGYKIVAATGKNGAGALPSNPGLNSIGADLQIEAEAHQFVNQAIGHNPDIEAAVLLVGGFAMGKLTDTGQAELDRMIGLNFYTAYNIVRPLLKHFQENKKSGQFILVGSRPGLDAAAGKDFFAYSMSKAMIFKLAEFINAEGKNLNITASVIVPSTIDTETNRNAMPGADFSKWVPAANIADAIAFCLSDTGKMLRENIIKIYNRS